MVPLLQFTLPPLPHYIAGERGLMSPGYKHGSRRNIGVFDLLYVVDGCLYMGEDELQYEVSSGHAFILRPDRYHYATGACQEDTHYYWIHFQTEGPWDVIYENPAVSLDDRCENEVFLSAMEATPFTELIPQFTRLLQPDKFAETLRELTMLGKSLHLPHARFKQQTLFQDAISQLSESLGTETPSAHTLCAEQAAAYLREHYREEVSAKALGESVNFHPVYIARCMQKAFGCSPGTYLMRYRIERAKVMLLQTELSVGRIAEEVGFNQAAYFTSCFVKYEGLSPRRYRQRYS